MNQNPQSSKNWRETPQKKGFFGSVIEQSNSGLNGPNTGKKTIGGGQYGGKSSSANRSQSAVKTVGRHNQSVSNIQKANQSRLVRPTTAAKDPVV